MKFEIIRQEQYSRGELLLRSFFGFIYIALPHLFVLFFMQIWGSILSFIAFWTILFTGRYPESFFEYQVKLINWSVRLNASLLNMIDGYPAFGLTGSHPNVVVEIPYPENLSRGMVLAKFFFGWLFVLLPHGFVLYFLALAAAILSFIAWWAVLFTGNYPQSMFDFQVGVLRWSTRVGNYLGNLTDEYPAFSLK